MFTSVARRRAGLTPARGSPRSSVEPPPSPSGSEVSAAGSGFGGGHRRPSCSGSGRIGLVLPSSIPDDGAGPRVGAPSPTGKADDAVRTGEAPSSGGDGDGDVDANGAATTRRGAKPNLVGAARSAVEAVVTAVERTDTSTAGAEAGAEAVRPVAAAMMKLVVALEALSPVGGGAGPGGPDGSLEAAAVASTAVRETEALAGGDEDEEELDAEEVEAAGAVLAEAGHAVKTLAQASIELFFFFSAMCREYRVAFVLFVT